MSFDLAIFLFSLPFFSVQNSFGDGLWRALFLCSLTMFLVQNSFGDGGLGGVFRCFSGILCVKPF